MNKTERIKLVKAMEYVARQINAEDIFLDLWLTDGVADGDIEYGDLEVRREDEDIEECDGIMLGLWLKDGRTIFVPHEFLIEITC